MLAVFDYLRKHHPDGLRLGLSGTPLEQSIADAWAAMRFFTPERLKELGLEEFDAFLTTFGRTEPRREPTPTGSGLHVRERQADWFNLPDMRRTLWEPFADVVRRADLGLNLPRLAGGRPQTHVLPQTPGQARMQTDIDKRYELFKAGDRDGDNHILKLMDQAGKNALHPRMLGMDTDGKIKLEVWADARRRLVPRDQGHRLPRPRREPAPGARRPAHGRVRAGRPRPRQAERVVGLQRDALAAGRPRRPRRRYPLRPGRRQRPEESRAVGRRPHRPVQLRDRQRPDRRHRGRRTRPAPGPGLHDLVVEPDPVRAVARPDRAPGQPEPRSSRARVGDRGHHRGPARRQDRHEVRAFRGPARRHLRNPPPHRGGRQPDLRVGRGDDRAHVRQPAAHRAARGAARGRRRPGDAERMAARERSQSPPPCADGPGDPGTGGGERRHRRRPEPSRRHQGGQVRGAGRDRAVHPACRGRRRADRRTDRYRREGCQHADRRQPPAPRRTRRVPGHRPVQPGHGDHAGSGRRRAGRRTRRRAGRADPDHPGPRRRAARPGRRDRRRRPARTRPGRTDHQPGRPHPPATRAQGEERRRNRRATATRSPRPGPNSPSPRPTCNSSPTHATPSTGSKRRSASR